MESTVNHDLLSKLNELHPYDGFVYLTASLLPETKPEGHFTFQSLLQYWTLPKEKLVEVLAHLLNLGLIRHLAPGEFLFLDHSLFFRSAAPAEDQELPREAAQKDELGREFDEEIWPLYPRKVDKIQAKAKYKRCRKLGIGKYALKTAVLNYARRCELEKTEPQFVMYGKTFFGPSDRWKEWLNYQTKDERNLDVLNSFNPEGGEESEEPDVAE